jgi:hypothetical protein
MTSFWDHEEIMFRMCFLYSKKGSKEIKKERYSTQKMIPA